MSASGQNPEVVVVGGGTMGIAAAWALAQRGAAVRVLERFEHVHTFGSHGGFTRIIRHAYHEGSQYVRLVNRADEHWMELERRGSETLLDRCGLLEFGPPDDPEFMAANRALTAHAIRHESLTATAAMERWPITMPDHWRATLSPDSGYLRVGPALTAMRQEAIAAGARFDYGVRVRELIRGGARMGVLVEDGEVISTDHVVLACGAYSAELVPELRRASARGDLFAQRRVLLWTGPDPAARPRLAAMPVWGAFTPQGFFYGFPFRTEGVEGFKLAIHTAANLPELDRAVDPACVDRSIHDTDVRLLHDFLGRHIPSALGATNHATVCMYGSTHDGDFLVDAHPSEPRLTIAAGFSGHGFKFAPVIGESIADLVFHGTSPWRLPEFSA